MARYDDFDRNEADIPYVTCRRCGEGKLHWRHVTSADGRREVPTLMDDNMRKHVCRASGDDFEELE
jgi:hypothetical protein